MLFKCYSYLNGTFLPHLSFHISHTEMHSYPFSSGGFLWQVQHSQLVAWRQNRVGHVQKWTGGSSPAQEGNQVWLLLAAYSLSWEWKTDAPSLGSTPTHSTWRLPLVCFRPSNRNLCCELSMPSAGTAEPACALPHRNHEHTATHADTNHQ